MKIRLCFFCFAALNVVVAESANAQCQLLRSPETTTGLLSPRTPIARHDDVLVVGVPEMMDGSVLVYRDVGDWVVEAELRPVGGSVGGFGASVSLFGETIAIGSPFEDSDAGALYFFERDAITGSWNQVQRLPAPSGAIYFGGGPKVMKGDRVALGAAMYWCDPFCTVCEAFAIGRGPSGWAVEARFLPDGIDDLYAIDVDLDDSGTAMVVGSAGDVWFGDGIGRVYVYRWDGSSWVEEARLEGDAWDFFGGSVRIDQDVIVVTAPWANGFHGEAYVFRKSGATWIQEAVFDDPGGQDDSFGAEIDVLDDRIVCADTKRPVPSLFTFERTANGWTLSKEHSFPEEAYAVRLDLQNDLILTETPDNEFVSRSFQRAEAATREYGQGWPGTNGVPSLNADGLPVQGGPLDLIVENSAPQATQAILLVGFQEDSILTNRGGTLLLQPILLFPFALDPGFGRLTFPIPPECPFVGLATYFQALELDDGASHGLSFTPGLEVVFGH